MINELQQDTHPDLAHGEPDTWAASSIPERPIILAQTDDGTNNPRVRSVTSITLAERTLKNGPRVFKQAKYAAIVNEHTGELHHHNLTLETWRLKAGQKSSNPSAKFNLEIDSEIGELRYFLNYVTHHDVQPERGRYIVIRMSGDADEANALRQGVDLLTQPAQLSILSEILKRLGSQPELLPLLIERVKQQPQMFEVIAAAQRLTEYQAAIAELEGLINSGAREAAFQMLLGENPWMFGSEYSEKISTRNIVARQEVDFLLRRTTDGFMHLVEIKTPVVTHGLFRRDESHRCWYQGPELSAVIGQVENYIEQIDSHRYAILEDQKLDATKIRATIIIGRDEDEDRVKTLRRLNGHLHRIQVITFDQLLRIARNAVKYLQETLVPAAGD